jgi:hypothetical protein
MKKEDFGYHQQPEISCCAICKYYDAEVELCLVFQEYHIIPTGICGKFENDYAQDIIDAARPKA